MIRKDFFSQLFGKNIKGDDPEYSKKVLGEALFRLKDYEVKNCTCSICKEREQKLREFVELKIKTKSSKT